MQIDLSTYKSAGHFEKLKSAVMPAREFYSHRVPFSKPKDIGASGNTFRVFRGIVKPSMEYMQWAFDKLGDEEFQGRAKSLENQEQFDEFHAELGQSLEKFWKEKTGKYLELRYRQKLLDIFIKRACELELPERKINEQLLLYGHVPLDSLVFTALDDLFSGIFLLNGRTMGSVDTEPPYRFFQELIRSLMHEIDSPALFFDFYAWNLTKQNPS